MTDATGRRPVRQIVRINILRGLFVLMLPLLIFTRPAIEFAGLAGELTELTGVFLVIFAVLGRFWSILYSGSQKNARVVQEGPYSVCRHPLYFFSTLGVAGLGLMTDSYLLFLLLTALAASVLTVTARKEESYLRETFGAEYEAYAARVPMIFPNPALYTSPPAVTVSVGPLRRNFIDAMVFLAFIPIAEVLEFVKEAQAVPTIAIW